MGQCNATTAYIARGEYVSSTVLHGLRLSLDAFQHVDALDYDMTSARSSMQGNTGCTFCSSDYMCGLCFQEKVEQLGCTLRDLVNGAYSLASAARAFKLGIILQLMLLSVHNVTYENDQCCDECAAALSPCLSVITDTCNSP